jgi:hypothetical protein
MKIPRDLLLQLLAVTKREQSINTKVQPQVTGCILTLDEKRLSTTSIVKDGKTSLSRFSFTCDDDSTDTIPVPDIDRMLGVLKYHGEMITLTYSKETAKVLVKSNRKQTTLVGGMAAKAFANSQQNLTEWHKTSVKRAKQVENNVYKMANGETRSPFATVKLSADVLHDALKCDSMNGQKLNRYTFDMKDGELTVSVGDHFKGLTETVVDSGYSNNDFNAVFEGGLENIVRYYKGDVSLAFLDFTNEGQGTRLIMSFDNGDWVFQAGVL